jgi:complement component 1 Q subcomponent-binding protein
LIQTVVQDGVFQIEEVSHFAKADLAQAQTAEKDWARQSLYAGPPFENLDEDLQGLWERYLEERGLNAEFANMIPDYISVKEQKEYLRWLDGMFSFLCRDFGTCLLTFFQLSRTSSALKSFFPLNLSDSPLNPSGKVL